MYYHLIEPNPLLSLIQHHFQTSKSTIIYSLSANPEKFKPNYQQLEEIKELVDLAIPVEIYQNSA